MGETVLNNGIFTKLFLLNKRVAHTVSDRESVQFLGLNPSGVLHFGKVRLVDRHHDRMDVKSTVKLNPIRHPKNTHHSKGKID